MTSNDPSNIPDWFWGVLKTAEWDLGVLVKALEDMTRERLIEYACAYKDAAQEICDYWDGPVVDEIDFSEDDTEDLCNWIVSRGNEFWNQAVSARNEFDSIVRLYWGSENGSNTSLPSWSTEIHNSAYQGFQSPGGIVYAIFEERFGESLYDYV